ncbi:MAG: 4Fe-4S cluster-binding domain-containing protein [Evtepia sp.]|uniref:4Fe-4S cluster-binding domain-containing protein n=1 Tax=Evtepia sp. TaxID=2773933 RepID=UPI002A7497DE|nr:4Fe-4S cluster-binding domain-containing protein [Evtepia sp.]MDY3014483.1 4Fe-4S cluster-binding domain-containing protein [Evtepia sp.]
MSESFWDPTSCTQCPRQCRGDRTQGKGRCRMPWEPMLARAALHHWEEPPLSGTRGTGTVFFSGCSLGCLFCQNDSISQKDFGKVVDRKRLREIFEALIAAGAHNIDLVNPTHYAHVVKDVLEEPLPVPVVWNSGGYDRVETLQALEGKIAIYLPDYKYPDAQGAARYSGAEDYPAVARAAIQEMVRQTGPYVIGEDGIMERGVIIRHLLLPGRLAQAKEVMDWVVETFPPHTVLFSLMSQYIPWGRAAEDPQLSRRLRKSEVRAAQAYMENLGLDGFSQEESAAKAEYIPDFDLTGL